MNEAHDEAVEQIRKMGVTNFDGFIFIGLVNHETGTEIVDSYRFCSAGSMSNKMGLAEIFREKLKRDFFPPAMQKEVCGEDGS